ncbi:MAG: DUF2530 domain-containing protein [Cumulibacter sp.]
MSNPLRPAPEPLQLDTRVITRVGTALFALAAVIIALVPSLRDQSDGLWLWTAIAGAVLGVLGQAVMAWQKAP